MFLDQELKSIRENKKRLAICGELRRGLLRLEVQGIGGGVRRTLSNLTLGLIVAEQLLGLFRKRNRRSWL